jgi:hypothetical protein
MKIESELIRKLRKLEKKPKLPKPNLKKRTRSSDKTLKTSETPLTK